MDVERPPADDPLAQPTRASLFELLGELKRPARTEELAERLGLHINGVRTHLDRLAGAGLVTRSRVRRSVGRPYDEWTVSPDAHPHGQPPHAYLDLGRWLVRAIPATKKRLRDVEDTGREIGRELAAEDSDEPLPDRIETILSAMGFQPRREDQPDGSVAYCLGNCPYSDAIGDSQQVVCQLHRGMTLGMLDALHPDAKLVEFEARDPTAAGCLIEIALAD